MKTQFNKLVTYFVKSVGKDPIEDIKIGILNIHGDNATIEDIREIENNYYQVDVYISIDCDRD